MFDKERKGDLIGKTKNGGDAKSPKPIKVPRPVNKGVNGF